MRTIDTIKIDETFPDRVGRFRISDSLVEENPEAGMTVMAHCLIVRCERMWSRCYEYTALSMLFDVTSRNMTAPEYMALCVTVNTGTEENPVMEAKFDGFQKIQ